MSFVSRIQFATTLQPIAPMKQAYCQRLLILVLASVLSISQIHAENCVITVAAKVTKVSFSGSAPAPVTGHHTLLSDDAVRTFNAPHYTQPALPGEASPRRYPIAYTKGSKPYVEMEFKMTMSIPEGETCTAKVNALGTDNFANLPDQTFTLVNGEHTYTYGPWVANTPFPDKIRFYGPGGQGNFNFNWQIAIDDGAATVFDTTPHRLYLSAGVALCAHGNRENFSIMLVTSRMEIQQMEARAIQGLMLHISFGKIFRQSP